MRFKDLSKQIKQSGKYFADNYYSNVIEYTNNNLTLPKMKTLKKGRYIVYLNLERCPFS